MNILIVEDSRFAPMESGLTLAKAGHTVTSASDAAEGLRLAQEIKPDLVILDMLLPLLACADTLRAIRNDPQTANIPILVLSSLPESNAEELTGVGTAVYFHRSCVRRHEEAVRLVKVVDLLLARTAMTAVQ